MADTPPTAETTRLAGVMEVSVVTPEGAAYEGRADVVVVPAYDGEVAFLRGHAPFVGQLGHGELRIQRADDVEEHWYLQGGVVQVHDDHVVVLAEHVVPKEKLDISAVRKALEEGLAAVPTSAEEFEARDRTLLSARARLRIIERHGLEARPK